MGLGLGRFRRRTWDRLTRRWCYPSLLRWVLGYGYPAYGCGLATAIQPLRLEIRHRLFAALNTRDCELMVPFHEPLSSKTTADLSVLVGAA